MVAQWFYQNAERQQSGPIDSKELRRLVEAGIVRPDTLVRKGGDGRWVTAEKVRGLFQRSASPPQVTGRQAGGPPGRRSSDSSLHREPPSPPSMKPQPMPTTLQRGLVDASAEPGGNKIDLEGTSAPYSLLFAWGWTLLLGAFLLFCVEQARYGLAALSPKNLIITIAYLAPSILILAGPTLPVAIAKWRRSKSPVAGSLIAVLALIVVLVIAKVCRPPEVVPGFGWSIEDADLANWDEVFASVEKAKVGPEPIDETRPTAPKEPSNWDDVGATVKEVEAGFDPEYLKELKAVEAYAQVGVSGATFVAAEWAIAAKVPPEYRRSVLERIAELEKKRGPVKDAGFALRTATAIAQGGIDMAMPVAEFFAPEELQLTGEQEAFRQALIATREENETADAERLAEHIEDGKPPIGVSPGTMVDRENDDLALREMKAAQDSLERMEAIDTSPKSKGAAGKMEKFMKEFMNQAVSQHKEYRAELDEIGWDRILDPERLARDTALSESKVTIREAKEIVDKYREQMNLLLANGRKEINALNLSAVEKAEAKQAYERGMRESRHQMDQIWELEREIVSEFGDIVDFLYRDYGNWSVSDGQLLFGTDEKVTAYNSYIASIDNLVADQEQLRRSSAQKVQVGLDRLRRTLGP